MLLHDFKKLVEDSYNSLYMNNKKEAKKFLAKFSGYPIMDRSIVEEIKWNLEDAQENIESLYGGYYE